MLHTYRELKVWQRGIEAVEEVYRVTRLFPREEQYGLVSQMRRAAVSIPANIAEGQRRRTARDFLQFLCISFGSGSELETHIERRDIPTAKNEEPSFRMEIINFTQFIG